MKYSHIISLLIAGTCSFLIGKSQQFYFIPTQTFKPYQVLGYDWNNNLNYTAHEKRDNYLLTIDSFNISKQITLGEYKTYLEAIKKDSSYSFYKSQLPDSAITSSKNYLKYITDKKYDPFPAVGITWEAAMNFCKWKTVTENKGGKINYIYRLPKLSEWLDAYNYLESNKLKSDFNKNYSDWTMNMYYDGSFTNRADSSFAYDIFYLPKSTDKPRTKRMRVIGDSYLFQRKYLAQHLDAFYTFNGYRQVAFRIVKEYIQEKKTLADKVTKYWSLPGMIKN